MVSHGLAAELQRLLDLLRRPAAGEQLEHLRLARREHRGNLRARAYARGLQQPEHADDAMLVADSDRAYLGEDAPLVPVDDRELEMRRVP